MNKNVNLTPEQKIVLQLLVFTINIMKFKDSDEWTVASMTGRHAVFAPRMVFDTVAINKDIVDRYCRKHYRDKQEDLNEPSNS